MAVNTFTAAWHIAPVVLATLLRHAKGKAKRIHDGQTEDIDPRDDIFFDQAFNIVKAFIAMGTKNTIESLQHFTNTHLPASPWSTVAPVTIPLSSCNNAADMLIEWFGKEELTYVVGGERWWQVRGLDGVDAEWVADSEQIDTVMALPTDMPEIEKDILRMECLESVLFYVHGGGYSWGSINTHRFQILRYARKIKGRAFAVNYRKAPQYPWPCALQDTIAAYLYLIRPPPGAIHMPVSPSKIVFAGDSAGGGLCLSVLTVLRDLELPMPAGAVLISPWIDLTHSFYSIMQNTATDIMPEHGFLSKPSTTWPSPCSPPEGGRLATASSNAPPRPGRSDILKPTKHREKRNQSETTYGPGVHVQSQQEMLESCPSPTPTRTSREIGDSVLSGRIDVGDSGSSTLDPEDDDLLEPRPPKVLMENSNVTPLEVRSQIQMYATTEQLSHPLVSPILQGSLGGLPPLYVIAGDAEVLRDEAIYLAHRAAHPSKYPARGGVINSGRRQKENAEKFTEPTKVHLQVYDGTFQPKQTITIQRRKMTGMCHVLTVFVFTKSARYAYRSIAAFVKHVTSDHGATDFDPFPILPQSLDGMLSEERAELHRNIAKEKLSTDAALGTQNPSPQLDPERMVELKLTERVEHKPAEREPQETEQQVDPASAAHFVRERVNIHGQVRKMEPADSMECLQVKPSQVGVIKEAPVMRWYHGQQAWDKRYAKRSKWVIKEQAKIKRRTDRLVKNAFRQGLVHQPDFQPRTADVNEDPPLSLDISAIRSNVDSRDAEPVTEEKKKREHMKRPTFVRKSSVGKIQAERRWGPLDLADERPPPTAIAGRRDNPDSLSLLRKLIYHTAPVTHRTVPTLKLGDALRAAFDPHDDPNHPPKQSSSEQQAKVVVPINGLQMWDDILRYFGRKSANGVSAAVNGNGHE